MLLAAYFSGCIAVTQPPYPYARQWISIVAALRSQPSGNIINSQGNGNILRFDYCRRNRRAVSRFATALWSRNTMWHWRHETVAFYHAGRASPCVHLRQPKTLYLNPNLTQPHNLTLNLTLNPTLTLTILPNPKPNPKRNRKIWP